jgi:hypothetical protein
MSKVKSKFGDMNIYLGILSVEILVVRERPLLKTRLGAAELVLCGLRGLALASDGELELLVGHAVGVRLGTVHRGVDLDTDVKVLAGEEVGLVGRENTTESRARPETLEGLGGGRGGERGERKEGGEARHDDFSGGLDRKRRGPGGGDTAPVVARFIRPSTLTRVCGWCSIFRPHQFPLLCRCPAS